MNVYEFQIPQLPGFTTIFAETMEEAISIHHRWFENRFEEPCEAFGEHLASVERIEADKALQDALRLNMAGVGSWDPVAGWIILEPELPAAGIVYREPLPVLCFEIMEKVSRERLLVFAANQDDAEWLFETYWRLHEGGDPPTYSIGSVNPRSFHAEQKGLVTGMRLGTIGIGSDLVGEWKILAPYDYAAGDI